MLKLTEGLGVTEVGIKVFEDVTWSGQRVKTTVAGNRENVP